VLLLVGRCHTHSGRLSAARDSLSSALEAVQRTSRGSTYSSTNHANSTSNSGSGSGSGSSSSGSDTALTAVPVHTATAELLAVMHAAAVTAATARAKKHAEQVIELIVITSKQSVFFNKCTTHKSCAVVAVTAFGLANV
jgi:hypothetical protein